MEPIINVNLKTIIDNYQKIKNYTNKQVIAVIKDNAYGHGLIQVGQALSSSGVYMLAVSSLSEAIALRKSMIFCPILLLGRSDEASILFSFKITCSIVSLEHLKSLIKSNLPLSIHLEIDTGMHRLGIQEYEVEAAINLIKNSKLKLRGIYTHFCSSDNEKQNQKFLDILPFFNDFKNLTIHAQASNYINQNHPQYNAVRTGLALYGYSSFLDVKPALTLLVPISHCHQIKNQTPIGYDYIQKSEEDGYILTIPWGYSHGLSRIKKLEFEYQNEIKTQIGKACMDLTMFFSKTSIDEGTYIALISEKNMNNLIKNNQETIYYVLSSLSSKIQRNYIK